MKHLKNLDHVAYVRFASVYREFTDIDNFMQELEALKDTAANNKKSETIVQGDGV